MDNRYYKNVVAEMQPFFAEHNFTATEDGSFLGETKAYRVEYDEPRQMYVLLGAEITEGQVGEYSEVCAWLFDDSQNPKDATAVGIDFTNTIRDNLGIRVKRTPGSAGDIALPTAEKNGSISIEGFTKKVLDVFPQYKDSYKEHVARYGNFLYLEFFATSLVEQVVQILGENNKKQNKKLYDLLENAYVQGDRETVNVTVAVICAAIYKDAGLKYAAVEFLQEDKHFQSSVVHFQPIFNKNKKLISALVK